MCDLDVKKDWETVDFNFIEKVLNDGTYLNERMYIWGFIEQVELLKEKQLKQATKNIPSLLKKEN